MARSRERHKEYMKEYRKTQKWKWSAFNSQMKSLYGIDAITFAYMENAQDRRCAICEEAKPLVLDHCHDTGNVRGLLCKTCNQAIGMLQDKPDVIANAATYVHYHRGIQSWQE